MNRKSFFASLLLLFLISSLFQFKQETLSYKNTLEKLTAEKLTADNLSFIRFQLEQNIDFIIENSLSQKKSPQETKNQILAEIFSELTFFQSKYPSLSFSYSLLPLQTSRVYILNTKEKSFLVFTNTEDFIVTIQNSNTEIIFLLPADYKKEVIS